MTDFWQTAPKPPQKRRVSKASAGAEKPAVASVHVNGGSKKRKYRNEPVIENGIRFDSRKEARRHGELLLLEKAGEISDLKVHPKYEFVYNGVRIGSFKPDFTYHDSNDQLVIEDTKSPSTRRETSYRLRKRMMLAFFGLEILET